MLKMTDVNSLWVMQARFKRVMEGRRKRRERQDDTGQRWRTCREREEETHKGENASRGAGVDRRSRWGDRGKEVTEAQ